MNINKTRLIESPCACWVLNDITYYLKMFLIACIYLYFVKICEINISISHNCHIYLCVLEVVTPSYAVGLIYIYIYIYIYIPEKLALFLLSLCLMMCANNQIQYDPLAVFVCLQITLSYHYHYADVSEGTERLP